MGFFGFSDFERILDRATSDELLEPDLSLNTELCDILRQREVKAGQALNAIKRKISQRKPMITLLALNVLEMCVSNCGPYFAREVASESFMQQMREWALPSSFSEQISYRLLELTQNWAVGFKGDANYQNMFDTYNQMRMEGFQFPECQITEAMFRVDQPPEWVESDQCNNCRTYFGPITRKHHCRNCGNIFCNACSSNDDPIPKFGYEKPVRTCDSCHVVLQSGGADAAAIAQQIGGVSGGVPSGPSAAEAEAIRQREEDDLMQAIAQSLHIQDQEEEQNKQFEQQLRQVTNQSAMTAQTSRSSGDSSDESDSDTRHSADTNEYDDTAVSNPDLAAYLNRAKEARLAGGGKISGDQITPTAASDAQANNIDPVALATVQNGTETVDPDDPLIRGLGASLKLFDSKVKSAQSLNRNVTLDTTIQSLRTSLLAMQPQLLGAMERNDNEKLFLLEIRAKVQRCIDTRNKLIETRRKHREEQELLQRMQLEQKLKLMQQQEQYQQFQQSQYQMQFANTSGANLPFSSGPPPGPQQQQSSQQQQYMPQHGAPPGQMGYSQTQNMSPGPQAYATEQTASQAQYIPTPASSHTQPQAVPNFQPQSHDQGAPANSHNPFGLPQPQSPAQMAYAQAQPQQSAQQHTQQLYAPPAAPAPVVAEAELISFD